MAIAVRQGMAKARGVREPQTEFRTSFTHPEGMSRTDVFQGRVVNVDSVNWTVDVVSQFDQMRLLDIPIASPYLHSNRGEGLYVMPEVGAKCVVAWPGDSSPPFVLAFVMPHETLPDTSSSEAPVGTSSKGSTSQGASSASFAGGRPRAKPGDIIARGRDGNYVILHRGGVLQIGSNELSQRLYIPLNNMVMDFAENYALHSAGGSIRWGISEGEGQDNLPSQFSQTFRVYANDKYADIRIAAGRVKSPIVETDKELVTDMQQLGVGTSDPFVYEIALSKGGFVAEDGSSVAGNQNFVKMRFAFDRSGNAMARFDGNVVVKCKKKLRVRVDDNIELYGKENLLLEITKDASLTVGGVMKITAASLMLNGGSNPVAKVGDSVSVALPPGLLIASPGGPVPLPPNLAVATGTVIGPGVSTILV